MDITVSSPHEASVSHQTQPREQVVEKVRYHYMDNLRALALVAGVLFHVGFAFNVITAGVWPAANAQTSITFDYWTVFLHTFRMPLFFLIAGFFAHCLVERRGVRGFVKNRALRIALPFILFWPLMLASIVGLLFYAAKYMDVDTPVIQLFRLAMTNPDALEGHEPPPISTTHLWFIYYLSLFCFSTALIVNWVPRMQSFYRAFSNPWVLFVGLPAITFFALARVFTPHPAPESFIPAPWALMFFGFFFAAGWMFFSRRELLSHIARFWPHLVASAVIATLVLMVNLPEPVTLETATQAFQRPQDLTVDQILRAAATATLAWHMTFLCLLAGHRLLDRESALLRYISDGSYWVYIIHLPIVMYLQFVFHSIDLPLWLEFFVISALALGAGYVSYAVLVRHTPIGWLLNGRRKRSESV